MGYKNNGQPIVSKGGGSSGSDKVGDLSTLTTTAKSSAVAAINEVEATAQQASTDASNAVTTANSVSATANQAETDAQNATTKATNNATAIGSLTSLTTSAKDSLVNAVNEVDSHADSATSTANSALTTANQASSDASIALANSNEAVTDANNAVTTANSANALATANQTDIADISNVTVTYNGVTHTFKNESTTLYVDTDANVVNGNDGLTSSAPIKLSDLPTIFDALKETFPKLLGTWTVNFAAGTYQGDGTAHMLYITDVASQNSIQFNGPSVSLSTTPTAIVDGMLNGTPYMHGFYFEDMNVKVSNIKFQNFSESSDANVVTGTRGGLVVSGYKGKLVAYNVHGSVCSWGGLVNQGTKRLYVEGGLFDSNRYGVLSMFNTEFTIGYNGSSSKTDAENTQFTNNNQAGVMIQSESGGHVDYCVFDSNTNVALQVVTSSDVNCVQSKFTNNYVAMSASANARILNSGSTFSGNTQDYDRYNNGIIDDGSDDKRNLTQKIDDATNFTIVAPSAGGDFYTETLTAPNFFGRGKLQEIEMFGRVSNAGTNTCDIVVKASDGTNPEVTLQTITIPSTSNYEYFNLRMFLSNYTQTTFTYDSDFEVPGVVTRLITHNSATLDATKDITLTFSLTVNGTSSTILDVYRTLSRNVI